MSKLSKRLEPLEHEFHLPAKSVPLQNLPRGKPARGKGGEHHDVLHVLPGFRPNSTAFAGGGLLEAFLRQFDGFVAFAHGTETTRDDALVSVYAGGPLAELPRRP